MQAQDILNNLNVIAEKLFKAVESQVYTTLDNIVSIGPDLLTSEPIKSIVSPDKINGLMIIANALLLFYIVYYVFMQVISLYNGNKTQNISLFVLRLILVGLLVNATFFLCEQLLTFFQLFSDAIEMFASGLTNKEVTFEGLKEVIISMKDFMKNDILSLDGIIKGMISFGAVSVLIHFSIRYVTVIFLVIVSPFAVVSLANDLTSGIFYSWIKLFVVQLFIQIIVKLLILIPILYQDTNATLYKIILVGTIYLIYKVNDFAKEILSRISSQTTFTDLLK